MKFDDLDDLYQPIIDSGKFEIDDLNDIDDEWTKALITEFICTHKIGWWAAKAGKGYIIKLDDKYLKYLISMPVGTYDGQPYDQFIWLIDDNTSASIYPDIALEYLLTKMINRRKRHVLFLQLYSEQNPWNN